MTNAVSIAQGGSNNVTMRNRIINGAMMIDQRNGGASVSTPGGAFTYGVDRFALLNSGDAGFSIQQVSDAPAGLKCSLKVTTTTAAGGSPSAAALATVSQAVEAYSISDINEGTANAQSLTLSFWVKSSLTGSFTVTAENNNNRTFLTTYTIISASTWEKKTVVIPPCVDGNWNVTTGRGIVVVWGLLGGSTYQQAASASWQLVNAKYFVPGTVALAQTLNATLQLSGVQLEAGTTASPFEYRQYGTELALCQRYYQTLGQGSGGYAYSGTTAFLNWFLPVVMRATQSINLLTTSVSVVSNSGASVITSTGSSLSAPNFTINGGYTRIDGFTGLTFGLSSAQNNIIGLSAELF